MTVLKSNLRRASESPNGSFLEGHDGIDTNKNGAANFELWLGRFGLVEVLSDGGAFPCLRGLLRLTFIITGFSPLGYKLPRRL